MKKTLTLFSALALPFVMNAQITLTGVNSPFQFGTEMVSNLDVNAGGIPPATPITGATINAWGAVYTSPQPLVYDTAINAAFPNAEHKYTVAFPLSFLNYTSDAMFGIDNGGIKVYGEHLDKQVFSLAMFTGNPDDTLVVPMQDVVYSTPRLHIAYPATYQSSWQSTYESSTNFTVTIASSSMVDENCIKKSIVTTKDTVIGWGRLGVSYLMGGTIPAIAEQVLQVRHTTTVVDSFYLNGVPAPNFMLGQFGLSQGQLNSIYEIVYYRPYEMTPLLSVGYADNTYSQPISAVATQTRLTFGAVKDLSSQYGISIYPNPAIDGNINVAIKNAGNADWSYKLINLAGQTVANGNINGNAKVSVSSKLAAGTYYISIAKDNEIVTVKPVVIAE